MTRVVTLVWLFLITLTTASWLLAERHAAPALLLGLAAVKFTLVAGWFMELRHAHRLWPLALGGLLLIIIITGLVWMA
ncbi:MAG TPA: cytochrome C oxidase subunit IV family protein [Prosthecobacter sp.]|jgi:hypothetical protein|nr:cytochrome C oxidase subunit IV family protein [Prosthecobacter sp.]